MGAETGRGSRYFRLAPLGDTLSRAELVERLRLLWQASAHPTVLGETLDLVIDALGLQAERLEIFGEATRPTFDTGENS